MSDFKGTLAAAQRKCSGKTVKWKSSSKLLPFTEPSRSGLIAASNVGGEGLFCKGTVGLKC